MHYDRPLRQAQTFHHRDKSLATRLRPNRHLFPRCYANAATCLRQHFKSIVCTTDQHASSLGPKGFAVACDALYPPQSEAELPLDGHEFKRAP